MKKTEPKKPAPTGPSFEELAKALPKNEQEELEQLKNVPAGVATGEYEDGSIEMNSSELSEEDLERLKRYMALTEKARELLGQKK